MGMVEVADDRRVVVRFAVCSRCMGCQGSCRGSKFSLLLQTTPRPQKVLITSDLVKGGNRRKRLLRQDVLEIPLCHVDDSSFLLQPRMRLDTSGAPLSVCDLRETEFIPTEPERDPRADVLSGLDAPQRGAFRPL